MRRGKLGPAECAFEAAGGDWLLAIALVLDLIRAGRLHVSRDGIVRA